tara:strand:+ start:728 stop:892 length:165 start_codon:yes stop_codon:yes gene_type:complete
MWATEVIETGVGVLLVKEHNAMRYSEAMNMHNYYMMKYAGKYSTYFVWRDCNDL